jgi:hypothetical protein
MELDFVDYSIEPYKIFNPRSLYAGKPPFELVVYLFDKPEFSDERKYPYYPIFFKSENRYAWVDKQELDDPEYGDILEEMRSFLAVSDAYPTPNWPVDKKTIDQQIPLDNNYEEDIFDSSSDCTIHYSDEELEKFRCEYNDYADKECYYDFDFSSDNYSDPLANYKQLFLEVNNYDKFNDFIDQSAQQLNDTILQDDNQLDAQELILEALIEKRVKNLETVNVPDKFVKIVNKIDDTLNEDCPINNLVRLLAATEKTQGRLYDRIKKDKIIMKFINQIEDHKIVEHLSARDHLRLYWYNNRHIGKILDYIEFNELDLDVTFKEILNFTWFDQFNIKQRGKYKHMNRYQALVKNPFKSFVDNKDVMYGVYSFCISYFLSKSIDLVSRGDVHQSIVKMLNLNKEDISCFEVFRKRYDFVYITSSYFELIKLGCLKFLK